MSRNLSSFAKEYLENAETFARRYTAPMLLWEADHELEPAEEQWMRTEGGHGQPRPRKGEPLVFELVKQNKTNNPFAMGITLGRIDSNDIVIDDGSISRFHCWFQLDAKTQGWVVVDAESRNGVLVNNRLLAAKEKSALKPGDKLRMGTIELRFVSPEQLGERIRHTDWGR